jgi:oligosaccharyltransferase complex subunit epsilon
MAPKSSSRTSASPAPSKSTAGQETTQLQEGVLQVWHNYVQKTPQRVKLLDCFLAFLAVVGAVQFVYCIVAGNFVREPSLWTLLSGGGHSHLKSPG